MSLRHLTSLLLLSFLTVGIPYTLRAENRCLDVFTRAGAERDALVEAMPALGHLTDLTGFRLIIKSGALMSYNDAKKLDPSTQKAIGGASDSIFLNPMFTSRAIRTGQTLLGPTLILSPSLLRRNDFFYNLDTWESMGGFVPYKDGSVTAKDATVSTLRRGAEFMFENPIPLDYVVGVWVPTSQKLAFRLSMFGLGGILREQNIPVFYADTLPPIEVLSQMAKSKDITPTGLGTRPHSRVLNDVDYNLRTHEEIVAFGEIPSNRSTVLFKRTIKRLNEVYPSHTEISFALKARALQVLFESNSYTIQAVRQYLTVKWPPSLKVKIDKMIREKFRGQLLELLTTDTLEIHQSLHASYREPYLIKEFFNDPAHRRHPDRLLLLYAIETGYLRQRISEEHSTAEFIRFFLESNFQNSHLVNFPPFMMGKEKAEYDKLAERYGLSYGVIR